MRARLHQLLRIREEALTLSAFPPGRRPGLVAFDLDGTLVDSIGDIARSANEALVERFGPSAELPVEVVKGFVGGGARLLIERCLAAIGEPPAGVDPVFERFLPLYRARLVETTRLFDGLFEALWVIERHATLAVLTNKPGDMSRSIVDALGLRGRFLDVIGGDDLATRKPDPEGLRLLATKAGVPIERVALVGDSAIDVRTAQAADALSIGVLWGYDREGLLAAKPDLVVDTPAALTRLFDAAHAVTRPEGRL